MDNLIEVIEYSKDCRLNTMLEMKTSKKKLIVYGANNAARVRIKLLNEYGIYPVACCVDHIYYTENSFCGDLAVYDIDTLNFENTELYIGFEDVARAREVVDIYKKKNIKVYFIEDPLFFKYMDYGFFLKNSNRYQKAYNLLEDDISRKIYIAALNGRIKGDSSELALLKSSTKYDYDFDLLELSDEEVFVDCGAYDGDTITNFLNVVEKYNEIYAFEADIDNVKKIEKLGIEKLYAIDKVVGNEAKIVRFHNDGSMFSNTEESGIWEGEYTRRDLYGDKDKYIEVEQITLDEILEGKKVTLIKMDIEGSELSALEGARNIIKDNMPKLAICVYHKPEDMFTLFEFIHQFDSDKVFYKYYLRHHADDLAETVLYAIPQVIK